MAHELTVRADGLVEMFSAGSQPVWHRLGQRTETAVTSEAAIRMAGLDWDVLERSLEVTEPDGPNRALPTHKAIVRRDTEEVLGVVGSRYTPLQNSEAFEWLDEVVGERAAIYETAGSIQGGRVVWMMIRLPDELRINGTDDVTRPYVLVCNSHDGTRALRVLNCSVRVVCSNTLTMALREGHQRGLALRHTPSIKDRVEEARRTLGIATRQFSQLQDQMNHLASVHISDGQARDYFTEVWPDNPEAEQKSRTEGVREQLLANFHDQPQRLAGIEGTPWAAFNAVSQYTDWQRPTRGRTDAQRDHNRLRSIWFGDSAAVKRTAWSEAMKLVSQN